MVQEPASLLKKTRVAVLALAVGLGGLSAPMAAADWTEVKSPHFTVYSDAGAKEARRVAKSFERFRKAMGALWGSGFKLDPGRPIVIFAARNGRSPNDFVPGKTNSVGEFLRSFDQFLILLRTDYKPWEGNQSLPPSEFLVHQHEYVHA